MKSIGPQICNTTNPVTVVKESGSPAFRGTVNLILNLSKTGDSLVQVPDQPAQAAGLLEQTAEAVHRVRSSLVAHLSGQKSPKAVLQRHHMTSSSAAHASVLWPSHFLPLLFISLSTLRLIFLPIKTFGGGARGFWKILWVV